MDLGIEGKRVLVTGGSRGIGLAAARAFLREGAHVVISARERERLDAAAEELGAPERVATVMCDMRRPDELEKLADVARTVDVLVNNAGATPTGRIESVGRAEWEEGLSLKVVATALLTKYAYEAMSGRGEGVIVNVIGNCGERPDPDIIIATVTNTGMMGFTRALGSISPANGVRVLGVNPGPTATERLIGLMQRKAGDRTGDSGRWQELVAPLPFGRAADPAETADMIVFAASKCASYVSGTILTVDGGVAARGHLF
ncbi:MAG: SDR family oxidoreductase [Rhizobiaceae bacterium]|nr:SDR family oxidoreductase [Rhizobiaceae bacterium]